MVLVVQRLGDTPRVEDPPQRVGQTVLVGRGAACADAAPPLSLQGRRPRP